MTFALLPDRRADLDPNGPAVSDGTRSLTNAGLLERVRAARRHLHELGIGVEDVVALKLRNRIEFVVLLFACWRLGATVTPVNPSLTDAEVIPERFQGRLINAHSSTPSWVADHGAHGSA
jgi:long-chain acyl-CoA synthetase